MSRNVIECDGWTFLVPAEAGGGLAQRQGIEHLLHVSDIAIDNRGRVRKNRYGARSPEPVEDPSPAIGDMDPLKPNPTLEDRLMLRHAVAYRFCGLVDGIGFFVTVGLEYAAENWGFLKGGDGTEVDYLLVERDIDGERSWCPVQDVSKVAETHTVVDIEDEKDAIKLALDITDGREVYPEWELRD